MAYQGNIMMGYKSVLDARAGIMKLEGMIKSKVLNYNGDK